MKTTRAARRAASEPARLRVAPVALAVRHVLFASVTALALTGPVTATAATPAVPAVLRVAPAAAVPHAVHDLTIVPASVPATPIVPTQPGDTVANNSTNQNRICQTDCAVLAYTATGANTHIGNTGTLTADSKYANAPVALTGIRGTASNGGVAITNSGAISLGTATAGTDATGVYGFGDIVGLYNSGDITVRALEAGVGLGANASGDILVTNDGRLDVAGNSARSIDGPSAGIAAIGTNGATFIVNRGDISVSGAGYGILATANQGDIDIDNGAAIGVGNGDEATGIAALSNYGDVSVVNSGAIAANGVTSAIGISLSAGGTASLDNLADLTVSATGVDPALAALGPASLTAGIYQHAGGDLDITNSGDITVTATYGDAAGINANAGGTLTIDNRGALDVTSTYGTADGIFAYATDVDVTHSGSIRANGGSWAAGIEAQATNGVSVHNTGTIDAQASNGNAFGVYATGGTGSALVDNAGGAINVSVAGYATGTGVFVGGGVGGATINNTGNVTVIGGYSNGLDIQSNGTGDVFNNGVLTVGDLSNTAVSTGIHVATAYDAGDVTVVNFGDVLSSAYFIATGIDVTATGAGSTVDITNLGNVLVQSASPDFTTTGIVGSGDADTTVQNGGVVYAAGGGTVDGIVATSATGLASVLNAGYAYAISSSGSSYATALVASSTGGIAEVGNLGIAVANSGYVAIAASANGRYGAAVDNAGQLISQATYAYGATVRSGVGDVVIDNEASGVIQAQGAWAMGVLGISTSGDVSIDNAGLIQTQATDITSTAVRGASTSGDVSFVNTGDVTAVGLGANGAVGALLSSTQGSVTLDNGGTAQALAYYNATALRGVATAGDVHVSNTGTAYALSIYGNATAVAAGSGGAIGLDNAGLLNAVSYYGNAIGVNTIATGALGIDNTGSIFVSGYGTALAVSGRGGSATVTNAGDISASATQDGAYGVYVRSTTGDARLTNSGGISVAGGSYGAGAVVIGAAGVDVRNTGTLAALGDAAASGIVTLSQGNTTIANTGTLRAQAVDAFGVRASSNGTLAIDNGGVLAVDGSTSATGIEALGVGATTVTTGAGRVSATSSAGDATAIRGTSYSALTITNGAAIDASAFARAIGIDVSTYAGALVTNTGTIASTSTAGSATAIAGGADGLLAIDNAGTLTATAYDTATGIGVLTNGDAALLNRGTVSANTATGLALGIDASAYGALAIENRSTITAQGASGATGVAIANGPGAASLLNSGTIAATATGGDAVGVVAGGAGTVVIDNRGLITATNDASAIAVRFDSAGTLYNSGTLRPVADGDGAIAVLGDAGVQDIRNSGRIEGALVTGAGNDRLLNGSGGLWTITGAASDFGSGDDVVTNTTGGTFLFDGGSVAFGSGDDVLTNTAGGTFLFNDGAAIHLGSSVAGNVFNNAGTIRVTGAGLIDMGTGASGANAKAFVNTGVLDFANGSFDDVLTVQGDLGGNGRLVVDADLDGAGADRLVVQGNVVTGAVQTVDMHVTGVPTIDVQPVEFARVTGTSTAGSFVAGQVTGFSAADFLNLRVAVKSDISTTNATPDIFYVGLDVAGLNTAGVLAATVAPGAHSLMASDVGSWRERMGIDPSREDGRVGLGPWIRFYGDRGRVAPANQGGSMGSAGDLRFDQSNHGHEVGFDANVGHGVHAGVLIGKSEGTQRLVSGAGVDRLRGEHSGVYGTWFAPNGSYVDVSYRWSNFDARLISAGVEQRTRGDGHAVNVEAGLGGLGFGAWHVVPQLQYTRSTIDNIDAISGSTAAFAADGGSSTRGRVGVEFNTLLRQGAVAWTPYGALSAVREFDGETRYAIDSFTGTTSTEGTSAKIDVGVGMQYRGVSVTGGASWTDGGALKHLVGGQLVVRYTW